MMSRSSNLTLVLSALALAACAASLVSEEPARGGAALELQTGPVSFQLGGENGSLAVEPASCGQSLCPILALRVGGSSSALKSAPLESGRVERLDGTALQADGLITQTTYEGLSEQGRVGKSARTEGPQHEQSGPI